MIILTTASVNIGARLPRYRTGSEAGYSTYRRRQGTQTTLLQTPHLHHSARCGFRDEPWETSVTRWPRIGAISPEMRAII